jgi:hypothetical protein
VFDVHVEKRRGLLVAVELLFDEADDARQVALAVEISRSQVAAGLLVPVAIVRNGTLSSLSVAVADEVTDWLLQASCVMRHLRSW